MAANAFDKRPNTIFSESTQRFLANAAETTYAVICGRNNCGKSFLLKTLREKLGEQASYLGPARYQNFNILSTYNPQQSKNRRQERYRQFLNQWRNEQQNFDNSPVNLQHAIASLTNEQRDKFIEIMERLLGSEIEIKHTVENNSMSQQYIAVDEYNISYTSSGYRLIATLVTSMLDEDFSIVLIDEPELGISPEAQGFFADFLFERSIREEYFPHIKTLIFATHSTIFLDRIEIKNNYFVEKQQDFINVRPVETIGDISRIHFFLLGNRFESLYLPSAIIICEGKTDQKFIERVLDTQLPGRKFSLFNAQGDGRTKEVLHIIRTLLGDIQTSPYRERIFIVLDRIHSSGLISEIEQMGIPENNVIVWDQNGIEYCYPREIIRNIFSGEADPNMSDDVINANGIRLTKDELCNRITPQLKTDTTYPEEFRTKFIERLDALVNDTGNS